MNWPIRCHDPDSCFRHQDCMYIQCPWQDVEKKELAAAMKKAAAARPANQQLKEPMSDAMKSEVSEAVRKVLKDGKWPVYRTQDDNGLEECEYVEFVLEVLAKMHRV